jgi:hypothetical protein
MVMKAKTGDLNLARTVWGLGLASVGLTETTPGRERQGRGPPSLGAILGLNRHRLRHPGRGFQLDAAGTV